MEKSRDDEHSAKKQHLYEIKDLDVSKMKIDSNKGRVSWLSEQEGYKKEQVKIVDSKLETLSQIPVLRPWLNIRMTDTTLNEEENVIFKERLLKLVVDKIYKLYLPLTKQLNVRNSNAVMNKDANRVRMESQLLVKVKQFVKLEDLAKSVRKQLKQEALETREKMVTEGFSMSVLIESIKGRSAKEKTEEEGGHTPSSKTYGSKGAKILKEAYKSGKLKMTEAEVEKLFEIKATPERRHFEIEYPREKNPTLRELLDQYEHIVDPKNFYNRPLMPLEEQETADELKDISTRREEQSRRKRYLKDIIAAGSSLATSSSILEQYPVPKETIVAIEKHLAFRKQNSEEESYDFIRYSSENPALKQFVAPVRPYTIDSSLTGNDNTPLAKEISISTWKQDPFDYQNPEIFNEKVEELMTPLRIKIEKFQRDLLAPTSISNVVKLALLSPIHPLETGVCGNLQDPDYVEEENGVPTIDLPPNLQALVSNESSQQPLGGNKSIDEALTVICTEEEKEMLSEWNAYDASKVVPSSFTHVPLNFSSNLRLEEIWDTLGFTLDQIMSMTRKYTHPRWQPHLQDAILLWEIASKLIAQYNDTIQKLLLTVKAAQWPRMSQAKQYEHVRGFATIVSNLREVMCLAYEELGDFITFHKEFYLLKVIQDTKELLQLTTHQS